MLYSILRSCALHGIDGYAYLVDVLGNLAAGWPYRRIDELLPGNWKPVPLPGAAPSEEALTAVAV